MKKIDYIVVVNTIYRPAEMLQTCLTQISKQTFKPKKVFIYDQNNQSLNLDFSILDAQNIEHAHLNVSTKSPSSTRNLLPANLNAEWILFCDDDGYLCDDYSEVWSKLLLKNCKLELVAGPYLVINTSNYYSPRFKIGGKLDSFLGSKLLIGGNFTIKTTTFNRIGRYDERFGPGAYWAANEETDLAWKAIAAKVNMIYEPKMIVYHPAPHDPDLNSSVKKANRYAIGRGALVGKWLIEKKSYFGFLEFFEMLFIPLVNLFRGIFCFDFNQIIIQPVVMFGRIYGLIEYIFMWSLRRTDFARQDWTP